MSTTLVIEKLTATARTTVAAGDRIAIPITASSAANGTIDVGSSNGNRKIPFTIPNSGTTDGVIYLSCGTVAGEDCTILNSNGDGLSVNIANGSVQQDNDNWAGDWDASTSADPVITINCTVEGTGSITIPFGFSS